MIPLPQEGEEADGEHDHQKGSEPAADGRLGKGVDGTDQAGTGQVGAQDAQHEGAEDEPDVPVLHHAALFLHHDRVQKGGAGEPGHERGIFHRVPAPVSAPPEHRIGPVRAEEDAAGQEEPGHHGPAAGDVNPLLARVAHHQRAEGKRERHAEAHVSQVKHRRMDHHLRILQQRIQSEAIGRRLALHQRKRRRGKVEQEQEEDLDAGQDGGRVSGEGNVDLMPQAEHKAVGGQQPRPEQQRPFLAGP